MDRSKENHSLLIKGGHVIDPAAKIDAPMDVLLRDGQVAEVAAPEQNPRLSPMTSSTRVA